MKRACASASAAPTSSSPSMVAQKYSACAGTKKAKRRRRSRAKPRPPITCLAAQGKPHFKAIVHHFTSLGCPPDHSLLLPNCPGIIMPSAAADSNVPPSSSSPAHNICGFTIAQSLKSSLQMILSCLQLLCRTSPSTMISNINTHQSKADLAGMYKAKTSLLMQALSRAGVLQEKETFSINNSCLNSTDNTVINGTDYPSSLGAMNPSPTCCGGNQYREALSDVINLSNPQYISDSWMQESDNNTEVDSNAVLEGHLEPFFANKEDSHFNIMNHEGIKVDVHEDPPSFTNSSISMQDTTEALERFLLEGDNTITYEDSSVLQQFSWHACSGLFAPS